MVLVAMASGGRRKAAAVEVEVEWADLPVELLGIISEGLENCSQTVAFRSVCQSWRFSTPPPPNKFSPLLPLKAPFFDDVSYFDYDRLINASAVYLVRPRSDPSNAWMVCIQEAAAGKLVLRHPLSYRELNGDVGLDLDADWIAATQTPITRFYTHNKHCIPCKGLNYKRKVVFVSETLEGSGCSSQLVGLCFDPDCLHFAFRLETGGGGFEATQPTRNFEPQRRIGDFVKFKGRIFAVDQGDHIYVLDHTNLQLVQATEKPVREYTGGWVLVQFVVSDGDLHLVWVSNKNPSPCEVYRLQVVVETDGIIILSEKVEDLGDRVFFLTNSCAFSMPAPLLPHPWRQGNCIFISDSARSSCKCAPVIRSSIKRKYRVFHLASRTFTGLWTPKGHSYLDPLFNPPASFVIEELTGEWEWMNKHY